MQSSCRAMEKDSERRNVLGIDGVKETMDEILRRTAKSWNLK